MCILRMRWLVVHSSHMYFEVRFVCTPVFTERTGEWFLSCMDSPMCDELFDTKTTLCRTLCVSLCAMSFLIYSWSEEHWSHLWSLDVLCVASWCLRSSFRQSLPQTLHGRPFPKCINCIWYCKVLAKTVNFWTFRTRKFTLISIVVSLACVDKSSNSDE